jgi:hypothetical protein
MHFFMSYKVYRMKSTTMFEGVKTRTLVLRIVIALGVGIAMLFVLTYIETGSVDIYQKVVAHRGNCVSGGGSSLACSNVDSQGQVNTGNNAAGQQ